MGTVADHMVPQELVVVVTYRFGYKHKKPLRITRIGCYWHCQRLGTSSLTLHEESFRLALFSCENDIRRWQTFIASVYQSIGQVR